MNWTEPTSYECNQECNHEAVTTDAEKNTTCGGKKYE